MVTFSALLALCEVNQAIHQTTGHELVCPPEDTQHDLIEGVSKCMISGQEAQAKFNEFREAQGSHDEVYTDGSKMYERVGAAAIINRHFQNGETTCRHLSKRLPDDSTIFAAEATVISLAHGPSPSWCSSLLWRNVLFAGNWGWRHREPFYLPYHEPALVIEWQGHTCLFLLGTKPLWHWRKWKSGPTSRRDPRPRYRPSGKCPLYRYKNHWSPPTFRCWFKPSIAVHGRDLYLVKPTLGPPKKFQHLTRAEEVVITRLRIGHTKATKSPYLVPRTVNWLSPLSSNTDHWPYAAGVCVVTLSSRQFLKLA